MKKFIGVIACVLVAITGCATHKNWTASDGSRSDGIVRLSYEEGALERAQLNEQQGTDLAAKKCRAWGYNGAEAFGGTSKICSFKDNKNNCLRIQVTKTFQCTGRIN